MSHRIWYSCPCLLTPSLLWQFTFPNHHVSWSLLLSYTCVSRISPPPPVFLSPNSLDDINPCSSITILQGSWARNLTFGSGYKVLCTRECLRDFKQKSLSFLHLKLASAPTPSWSHLVGELALTHALHLRPGECPSNLVSCPYYQGWCFETEVYYNQTIISFPNVIHLSYVPKVMFLQDKVLISTHTQLKSHTPFPIQHGTYLGHYC